MQFSANILSSMHPIALFGIMIFIGLVSGEVIKKYLHLPKISAYILIGFLLGPCGFNFYTNDLLANTQIFITISLGAILFELGRHLDFAWLRNDKKILLMSFTESLLTFSGVYILFHWFAHVSSIVAALAATIAVATSPAVVMMIIQDVAAEGPTTRRSLILTSMNNLIAIALFTLLLPLTKIHYLPKTEIALYLSTRLLGSVSIPLVVFLLTIVIAKIIGKNHENQRLLLIGAILTTIGLSVPMQYSSMLSALVLGIATRNLDRSSLLMEIKFGWLIRLFSIILFVVMGANLQLKGIWHMPIIIGMFILLRIMAKFIGVFLFAKKSRLTSQQAMAIGLTLLPMADVAIGMSTRVLAFDPQFGHQLLFFLTANLTILNIIGPPIVQYAFNMVKETNQDAANS